MMTDSKLRTILQPIVHEYGLGLVLKSLGEIAHAQCGGVDEPATQGSDIANGTKQEKPRVTAPDYVEKMNLPVEKVPAVSELARRFQEKSFMPTFGDITSFCQMYEIPVPASKGRASAIPRVFRFIAEMEPREIQQMLDDGMFSGPSRLGPIADGIRNYSSAAPQGSLEL